MEEQSVDLKVRIEEHTRSVTELTSIRTKLTNENIDISHQLEDAESKVKILKVFEVSLYKIKIISGCWFVPHQGQHCCTSRRTEEKL